MLIEPHINRLRSYIRAKDDSKPLLMHHVFTQSATLAMNVKTDNISFPSDTVGLDAITDVLVRDFNKVYENVYTFCLSDSFYYPLINQESTAPSKITNEIFCDWLVCMTERESGNVRVGTGKYHWHFDNEQNSLVNHLVITIEQMITLTPEFSNQLFEWIGKLHYPFCDSDNLLKFMPKLETLEQIRKNLESGDSIGSIEPIKATSKLL